MAFLTPGPMELAVIAVIALVVLGPSRLPEAARAVGKGMREMRDSFQEMGEDDEKAEDEEESEPDDAELPATTEHPGAERS